MSLITAGQASAATQMCMGRYGNIKKRSRPKAASSTLSHHPREEEKAMARGRLDSGQRGGRRLPHTPHLVVGTARQEIPLRGDSEFQYDPHPEHCANLKDTA